MDNFNQIQTTQSGPVAEAPKKNKLPKISYNSPVVLTFAIVALIILILDKLFNEIGISSLFRVSFSYILWIFYKAFRTYIGACKLVASFGKYDAISVAWTYT